MTDDEAESLAESNEPAQPRGPFRLDVTVHLDIASLAAVFFVPPVIAGIILALLAR